MKRSTWPQRAARAVSLRTGWSVSASRGIARPLFLGLLVTLVPLGVLLLQPALRATVIGNPGTILVNTTQDDTAIGDGQCSLRKAVRNANNPGIDETGGDCALGTGNDTI